MYMLIVYDVGQKRVNKVCKFLRRYLTWVQNSVFEGETTEARLESIKRGLKGIIDQEEDSVLFYSARDQRWLEKEILGIDKNPTTNLL